MWIGRLIGTQVAILALAMLALPWANASDDLEVLLPQVFLNGIAYDLDAPDSSFSLAQAAHPPVLHVAGQAYTATPSADAWRFNDVTVTNSQSARVYLELNGR